MDVYKVYIHTFTDGSFYVGTTKNTLNVRKDQWYQHNRLIKNKVKQFGWRLAKSEILIDGLSQNDAFEYETRTIKSMRKEHPNLCLNISDGGKATRKGLRHTEESKRLMSERAKGKVFSEDALKHMRESHKKERKPVVRVLDGTEEIFESLNEAAISVNGYKPNVTRSCISGKPYKGYFWKWYKGGDER